MRVQVFVGYDTIDISDDTGNIHKYLIEIHSIV